MYFSGDRSKSEKTGQVSWTTTAKTEDKYARNLRIRAKEQK
jgi:hypothetical protein